MEALRENDFLEKDGEAEDGAANAHLVNALSLYLPRFV